MSRDQKNKKNYISIFRISDLEKNENQCISLENLFSENNLVKHIDLNQLGINDDIYLRQSSLSLALQLQSETDLLKNNFATNGNYLLVTERTRVLVIDLTSIDF